MHEHHWDISALMVLEDHHNKRRSEPLLEVDDQVLQCAIGDGVDSRDSLPSGAATGSATAATTASSPPLGSGPYHGGPSLTGPFSFVT